MAAPAGLHQVARLPAVWETDTAWWLEPQRSSVHTVLLGDREDGSMQAPRLHGAATEVRRSTSHRGLPRETARWRSRAAPQAAVVGRAPRHSEWVETEGMPSRPRRQRVRVLPRYRLRRSRSVAALEVDRRRACKAC